MEIEEWEEEKQTEIEGYHLRARSAVNKGRTADSTQLSIIDYI